MLAIDRCIFDIPLQERLQSRTSDLVAWTKTMLPTIRHSINEAQNQLRTGHQGIRTYFSDTAVPERNVNATLATATQRPPPVPQTALDLAEPTFDSDLNRQETSPLRLQTKTRRSRHHDIRNYLSGATVAVTTTQAMQAATEEPITPKDNIFSRCRALRNRLQPSRTQVT
jgi:hypothetical protein